jgi:hypothetical protein
MKTLTIQHTRGDTFVRNLTIKEDGTPIDITGYTVVMTIKTGYEVDDDDATLQKEVTSHTDPTNGITDIVITPDEWEDIVAGEYVYDIQITTTTGAVYTPMSGVFLLTDDVTKASFITP